MFTTKKICLASMLYLLSFFAFSQMGSETLHNKSIPSIHGFFPKVDASFVGDPMPIFADGVFNIFYLNDIRGGSDLGVHAVHLLTSSDLYHYTNHSEVLPYINDVNNPELLLGTGSFIKVGDTWHAWYTAHNANVFPVESVMHATSSDKINWVKHYQDTILPGKNYSGNDFRDPHVVWIPEKQQYWMLITTRQNGKGVIVKYSSTDLKNWQDDGVFFDNDTISNDSNLECPTLVFFNNKWYLSFSDQWPTRLTQYRVADNPEGPFVKLKNYAVDGAGFYAGKLAMKDDHLYVFGWNPTKSSSKDSGNIDWAGNLVAHELIQNSDGSLSSVIPTELNNVINSLPNNSKLLKPNSLKNNITTKFDTLNMQIYDVMPSSAVIEGTIKGASHGIIFNFGINENKLVNAPLNIVLNKAVNKVFFYNSPLAALSTAKPELGTPVDLSGDIHLKILIENSIAVFYINDKAAFTARMYDMVNNKWGLSYSINDNPTIELNIKEIK
ncbi:glycoside hydrolase family 32 protein [Orbus wheelerorum]|uniref:family 43 glycosylhydrolase n=1 Tax=Orbus wheelerorum TaxID=3074111 RepID=UPI00370D1F75